MKRKPALKKLELVRQALRELSSSEAGNAAGGVVEPTQTGGGCHTIKTFGGGTQ